MQKAAESNSPRQSFLSHLARKQQRPELAAMAPKRGRPSKEDRQEEEERRDEPRPSRGTPSIGEQTSGIKNKLRRSEMYSKLKAKQGASERTREGAAESLSMQAAACHAWSRSRSLLRP
jgi:hypothetical protein